MNEETVEVSLPSELVELIDEVVNTSNNENREKFVEEAIRIHLKLKET